MQTRAAGRWRADEHGQGGVVRRPGMAPGLSRGHGRVRVVAPPAVTRYIFGMYEKFAARNLIWLKPKGPRRRKHPALGAG